MFGHRYNLYLYIPRLDLYIAGCTYISPAVPYHLLYLYKTEKTFKNYQRSKDAAAKKRPNTSEVGKINNYYEDIYIPPYNNTD